MQQLLIFSISVALVYAKTTFGDSNEGESSSSLEVNHGSKYDQGYSFGDTKSSGNQEFDQGSFGEDQSGIDENQGGDGGYQHEEESFQDGGGDSFGRGYEGQYNNEGFEQSKGYQSDDGESEGYEDNRKGY